jgi:hypothetical protein
MARISAQELIKQLDEKIKSVKDSDTFKQYLQAISKFTRYKGWRNRFQIMFFRPHASFLATYKQWEALGYRVIKGQKGLALLRPQSWKVENSDGEIEREGVSFRPFYVFSDDQITAMTPAELDAKGIAEVTDLTLRPDLQVMTGQDTDQKMIERLLTAMREDGINVTLVDDLESYGVSRMGRVELRSNEKTADLFCTGVHEYAHEILHKTAERKSETKAQLEFEAEASAYVVCQWLGIPVRSENYLLHFQKYDLIKGMPRIAKCSDHIMSKMIPHDQTREAT